MIHISKLNWISQPKSQIAHLFTFYVNDLYRLVEKQQQMTSMNSKKNKLLPNCERLKHVRRFK